MNPLERIAANVARVRERIAAAAAGAARSADEIALVAITKYVDTATTRWIAEAGCLDLGESRPQQLWDKAATLSALPIRWHMIGHLQRNKVRRTLPFISLLHSGDSLELLRVVDREWSATGRPERLPVLLEVNISGEASKHGFAPEAMPPLGETLVELRHIEVRGLMAMAGLDGDANAARRDFAAVRELRDRLQRDWSGAVRLEELSLGMSGDFEQAVAEGSTLVRIGSALFEGLDDAD